MVPSRTVGCIGIGVWVDVTSNSTALAYLEKIDAEPSPHAAGDRLATDAPSSSSTLITEKASTGYKGPPAGEPPK